jgi:DNA-binding transcriptional regulator YiaG
MTNGYIIIMTSMELKQWREKNGYTQVTLARALNVYQETVARWETGVREIPSFLHLALDALECEKKEVNKSKGTKKTKKEV